jgi:hypothetical protein
MNSKAVRRVLAILLTAVAVLEIAEGTQGHRTLVLAILVGGSCVIAAGVVLTRPAERLFFAAAAGLITIIWELTRIAVVDQFSTGFVLIGLAVIALSEFLWVADAQQRRLPPMKHELIGAGLLALEAFIAVGAIAGSTALLRGAFAQYVPVEWLAGTPFSDYTLPGLVLVLVVGGTSLIAATTVFIHREWPLSVSMLAGAVMAGFLVVEALSLDSKVCRDVLPMVLGMQILYFVPGLGIFALAGFLWMNEYRSPGKAPKSAWPAGTAADHLAATRP